MELYYIKVIEAYTMALTAKSMFQASSEDLKFARELGRFTKVELDGGAASQTDYLQVQAKLKLAQADSIQAFLNYQASLDKLKILIGLDIGEQITITPTDTSDWYISAKAQPGERRDLKLKTLDKSIKHNQIKYEKGGLYPFISLVGGMNSNIYDYNNFSTGGPEDLINPDMFNYQVGLQLKWVLFDGLATPSKVKQANYEAKSLERELSKLKKEISIARSEVKRQVQASAAIVGAATSAYEAASTAITQARRDHKEGIMGLSRLLEAETAYKGALVQYHHAVAGKILAHAYYKFAHGIDILEGMK
jgi:outer membrane protein TolC